jgi:hypothetical protein
MFDKNEYWQKKQLRKTLAEKSISWRALAFLSGFFYRDPIYSEPTVRIGHTRSAKERRMRRIRHRSMMRNQAA